MMLVFINSVVWLVLLMLLGNANGSHFRGGLFMVRPKPGGTENEMEIFYHISWRRSSSEGSNCDITTIENAMLIGAGSLTCQSGCGYLATIGNVTVYYSQAYIDQMTYYCTDYSLSEDWSFGERKTSYIFPNSTTVTIGFATCCWIKPFSSSLNLITTFSTVPRKDTGVINSTPRAATSPVIRLKYGNSHTIRIPVSDPDGDVVKCRWGNGSECYDICGGFPGATINTSTCTISYTANNGTGYKPVAVAIEDFQTTSSPTPFSTVVLQFLVYVYTCNDPLCLATPYFESPPTFKQGICIGVERNGTLETQIIANSNSSELSISEIVTISPSGSVKGTLTSVVDSDTLYYMNITWTPSIAQHDQTHVLCYTAISSIGSTSEQSCIQIHPGILPPAPNINTLSPANNAIIVSSSGTTWSLQFDKVIQRPSVSAFIKFHNATNDEVVYMIDSSTSSEVSFIGSQLFIIPNYDFPDNGDLFYITFERGIVNGLEGCGPASDPVTDKTFWTFQFGVSPDFGTTDHVKPTAYSSSTVGVDSSPTAEPPTNNENETDSGGNANEVIIPAVIAICSVLLIVATCGIIIFLVLVTRRRHHDKQLQDQQRVYYDATQQDATLESSIFAEARRRLSVSNQRGIVYSIQCKTCLKVYIGETDMTLDAVLSEHSRKIKAGDHADPISLHVMDTAHEIDWDGSKVVATVDGYHQRKLVQQVHVQSNPNNLNLLQVNPLFEELQNVDIDWDVFKDERSYKAMEYLLNNRYIEQ